jgi:hypothetical protein
MVAGRCLWSDDEQRPAQHQAGGGGYLGVEGVVEDGLGAGEAGCLRADVGSGGEVDQQHHGEAEQAEGEDDPPQAAAALVAHCGQGENRRGQRHRDQQVGMGPSRRLGPDRRRRGGRQPRVARLADLHRPIVDELAGDQEPGGGEDRQADHPLGREDGAGAGRATNRQRAGAQQAPFEPGEPP